MINLIAFEFFNNTSFFLKLVIRDELEWLCSKMEDLHNEIRGNAVLEETCSDILIKYNVSGSSFKLF